MKQLNATAGTFGPFSEITDAGDAWHCDGVVYQKSVVGNATVGSYIAPPPSLPTIDEYTAALTDMLDKEAQSHRYDDRISCALRAGYAGPFHAEGVAFASWMDGCNAQAYTLMAQVQAGTAKQPTMAEFLAIFPAMVWPA